MNVAVITDVPAATIWAVLLLNVITPVDADE